MENTMDLVWFSNRDHIKNALEHSEKIELSIKKIGIKSFKFEHGEIIDFEFNPKWDYQNLASCLANVFEQHNLIIQKI